uniref:Uncharacterized protein n=1 Tax=Megaselia scalaris TaxID=36166 RepID=T1H514_MEGSC
MLLYGPWNVAFPLVYWPQFQLLSFSHHKVWMLLWLFPSLCINTGVSKLWSPTTFVHLSLETSFLK